MFDTTGVSGAKVIWLTGLPGAGKSTIARAFQKYLSECGITSVLLDGDELRSSLNSNLGFSDADRMENIRRTACIADLLRRQGIWTIAALITPKEEWRQMASEIVGKPYFELIFVKADLETCISRDPKRLYEKALNGIIRDFTGISAPFEPPASPDLVIDTDTSDVGMCVNQLIQHLFGHR